MDDETIHDVIGTIYEAPLDPRKWDHVVQLLRQATRSQQGHLFSATIHDNLKTWTSSRDLYLGFDNEQLSFGDVLAIGQRIHDPSLTDPHLLRFDPSQAGKAFLTFELLPVDEWSRSTFYNEFARFFRSYQGVAAMMVHDDGRMHALAFYRSAEDPLYGEEDKRLVDVFVPHIRRAIALYSKLQAAHAQATVLRNSIDTMTSATVLLDQSGKVILLNAAAERLLKRCPELFVRRDRLCARHHADAEKLHQLIKRVTNGKGRRSVGGAVTVQRAPWQPPLQVMAAPVSLDVRTSVTTGLGSVAMLIIQDPNEETRVPQEVVATMFGLTSAETRLLMALINGRTVKEYADDAGLTQNTVRAYLKSIFAKTKTSRQSDLVRLMSGLRHSVAVS